MRQPKYLSPTSVSLFYKDRTEFYLRYLADDRPPRMPQTEPMGLGSGFDAFVKAYISDTLKLDLFEKRSLFELQVEKQNWDSLWIKSEEVFNEYLRCGALADLIREVELADSVVRMEDTVRKTINGVPLLGKPDLFFFIGDIPVIIDWKVNGYFSKAGMSPAKGYTHRFDTGVQHKNAVLGRASGIEINTAQTMEQKDASWGAQLTTYAWLLGAPIGGKLITGIDQLSFRNGKQTCSKHRERISPQFQRDLMMKYEHCWKTIQGGHIFDDLTAEESVTKQKTLDERHKAFAMGHKNQDWLNRIGVGGNKW